MHLAILLVVLPLVFGTLLFLPFSFARRGLVVAFALLLAFLSVVFFFSFESPIALEIHPYFHLLFLSIDTFLLLYFLSQGIIKRSKLVSLLALVQIVLFAFVVFLEPAPSSATLFIEKTSAFMYLIINIVGGAIIVFALEYMQNEQLSGFKKDSFTAMLFLFLGVMNLLVSANDIELFFLLFELTTLFSYLLIAFRKDDLSVQNALRALWMNQLGGVAILIALLFSLTLFETKYFDTLFEQIDPLAALCLVFLSFAAFIKGGSLPFEKWLLGAMVAPTPVSAILHSATMVKIAPFLMLKLSIAMSGFVSLTLTLIGTFIFFAASLMALSKDYFKEILGLSTIALLALMMALAAVGTKEAYEACLLLMVFHAISKALLFLQAGILEKVFHLKYVQDIDGLVNDSPLLVFFILIGFASLTLPPFGAFVGKLMAIESIAQEITSNPLYAFALVFLALGSIFLTLLYFKVVTKLFAKDPSLEESRDTKLSSYYTLPSAFLSLLLFGGGFVAYDFGFLGALEVLIPFVLLVALPLFFALFVFPHAHRVKEYHCGEKDQLELAMFSLNIPLRVTQIFYGIVLFGLSVLLLGALL